MEDNSNVKPEDDVTVVDPIEDLSKLTPIQNKYAFWYKKQDAKALANYKDAIVKIGSFQTVEKFWQIYDHIKRPHDFKVAEFHLFKDGITPFWEDPQNKVGGKWMIRLRKGIVQRYWEDILLAIIGEQFDVGSEICGAVVSIRINEDILSVWNKTADNKEAVNKIRDSIRKFVRLPSIIPIEYKRHEDSLTDRSSYRNPTMVWRPAPKPNNGPFDKDAKPFHTNKYHENGGGAKFHEGGKFQNNEGQAGFKNNWKNSRWAENGENANHHYNKPTDSGWRKFNHHGNKAEGNANESNQDSSEPTPELTIPTESKPLEQTAWKRVNNPFAK